MAINKVEICGVDTGKLPRISYKKSTELLERIKSGDESARDEFIQANLRLVLSVIQRFSNRGEQPDDLFQVGCIGLIKAIDNFDLSHNVRFSTYAVPMIIGEIRTIPSRQQQHKSQPLSARHGLSRDAGQKQAG